MSTTILLITLFFAIINAWFLIRINKVMDFLIYMNQLSYDYSIAKKSTGLGWRKYYDRLPSFYSLIWSFKRLNVYTFFSNDEVEELLNATGHQ